MKILLLLFLVASFESAHALSTDSIPLAADERREPDPNRKAGDPRSTRDLLLTPFVVPGYSPDIQFTLTAGGIFSFHTKRADSLVPRCSVPVTITYSSTGAFIASSSWVTFWLHDKLRVNALLQYKSLDDVYFGVGYANALNASYPDSTGYHRRYFVFQFRPLWRLGRNIFGGLVFDYNRNILGKINPHLAKDLNYRQFGRQILAAGVGVSISYDSRDFPQNPYRGFLLSATYTNYGRIVDANTLYGALDLDSRVYLPLSRRRIRTLAINWRSRYEFGEVPFTAMPSFGSPFDLRGYRYGQFRDRYSNYAIAEYRHKLYLTANKPSRYGFVLWGGLGAIGPDLRQSFFGVVLPDAGIGFRFEVQPRLNVRLDIGYCPTHVGVYANFPEAY